MAANDFDLIGRVTHAYFYRVTGRLGDLLLSFHVTDFADKAWELKDISFGSLTEVQYDYDIGEKQLYQWLQPRFASGRFIFSASEDGGAHIQVQIREGEINLDVRIPAEGELKELKGEDLQTANQGLASAMYQQMKAAQDLEARRVAEKVELESKISEMQRQARTAGSREFQTPTKGASTSRDQSAVAGGSSAATPASKRARDEDAAQGNPDGISPTKETKVKNEVDPSVGRARIVQGRGRGRQGIRKGFGRLGGS